MTAGRGMDAPMWLSGTTDRWDLATSLGLFPVLGHLYQWAGPCLPFPNIQRIFQFSSNAPTLQLQNTTFLISKNFQSWLDGRKF
jgi:hypothetical protein